MPIFDTTLKDVGSGEKAGCLCHAYCHRGECTFLFNGRRLKMVQGDCLIVRRSDLLSDIHESDDFKVDVVYVTPQFITIATPQSNYGMRGSLALFNNPIMHLTPEQQTVCRLDFDYVRRRLSHTTHRFYRDAIVNAVQAMIIDFFDFHATLYGEEQEKVTQQHAMLMNRFLALLERGDYRRNREIGYYADILCVTPKYLSEVSKKVSGFPAAYWITRYTSLDIVRLLRSRRLSLTEISDMFGFSSVSYFSRYVQKYLGAPPSDFTE
ncbi:MAG: helix-turn-helix domain-containing protein [Prevotellaceae bacterium]|nr:helix-turn-helix domain-containing protein [Prevotellaceae bacterium]MDO4932822.1 helix-turn-helix domain-containing protein [Prevotellaceae bacterium]